MSTGRHSTVTAAQRGEFWRRYKAGESVLGIINAPGQRSANIHRAWATGGIAPVPRTRSQRALRFGEREEISRGLAAGDLLSCYRQTVRLAKVSTVSQEVARHGGRRRYRAAHADSEAWESARRPKLCLLSQNQQLQRIVAVKLEQDWSPQQIAGLVSETTIPVIRRCGCHTRRSIEVFLCRRAAP